jgi:archaellum component FlaC
MLPDQEKLEKMISDIQIQLDTEKKTAEIIAETADTAIKSHDAKFDAIEKGLSALLEKIENLASKVEAIKINEIVENVEKSINEKLDAAKAQLDIKVEDLAKSAQSQKEELETLQKTVEVMADEPVIKSITVTAVEPVAEVKTEEKPTIDMLIKKASEELKTCTNNQRSNELFKAIVSLESGIIPKIKL